MNRLEIMEKILEILNKSDYFFLHDVIQDITEESKIIEDLSMDSIQVMEFIVDIEDMFGIRFDFNKFVASDIEDVGAIISVVVKYLADKKKEEDRFEQK